MRRRSLRGDLCNHQLTLWRLRHTSVGLLLWYQVLLPYLSNVWWKFTCRYVMKLLMMNKYLWWQSFEYPRVSQCLIRWHPLCRVPMQASLYEIHERLVLAFKDLVEWLSWGLPDLTPLAWYEYRLTVILEELFSSLAILEDRGTRDTADFHHHS
jgi:hypothetical protein